MSVYEKRDKDSKVGKCIHACLCCVIGWLRWIDKRIEHLTAHALAMVAITGDSYYASARVAFRLSLKHIPHYDYPIVLSKGFVVLGIFTISTLNTIVYVIMLHLFLHEEKKRITNYYANVFFCFLLTVVISTIVIGLLTEAVTATFMCYAIDLAMHNGKPIYGSIDLH